MTPKGARSLSGRVRSVSQQLHQESLDKKKVRFSTEVGAGGACAITLEEQVEDFWSDERSLSELFEGTPQQGRTRRGLGGHRGYVGSSAGKWRCARHSPR